MTTLTEDFKQLISDHVSIKKLEDEVGNIYGLLKSLERNKQGIVGIDLCNTEIKRAHKEKDDSSSMTTVEEVKPNSERCVVIRDYIVFTANPYYGVPTCRSLWAFDTLDGGIETTHMRDSDRWMPLDHFLQKVENEGNKE